MAEMYSKCPFKRGRLSNSIERASENKGGGPFEARELGLNRVC